MLKISKSRQVKALFVALQNGFSLIEMAVVLMIVGLLLNGLFLALGSSAEGRARSEASSQLQQIEEALYGFAQANGRLPCPAIASAAANLLGRENPSGGGTCNAAHGFVPAATLGLQGSVDNLGLLLDPWGRPYRYSVSVLNSGSGRVFTSAAGMRAQFAAGPLPTGNPLLCVAEVANCISTPSPLTNSAPAVVFSVGASPSVASTLEAENAGATVAGFPMPNDVDFVSTTYADEGAANAFDDILIWLSPNVLVTRMISAGQLP